MGAMKSYAAPLFFALTVALMLCAQGSQADSGGKADLTPDIPFCGHISTSSFANYTADVDHKTSAVKFVLRWRNVASPLDLSLRSPSSREIVPEASTDYVRGKTSLSYIIKDPEAGVWIAEDGSGKLSAEGEDYCLSFEPVQGEGSGLPKARFNGLYSDHGVDEDGDGLNEYVILEVGLNVSDRGNYSVEGLLYDANDGSEIPVYNASRLNFGPQYLQLQLYGMRTLGPYHLKSLILYDEKGNVTAVSKAEYITSTYGDLEFAGAILNGQYCDYGSDINDDGLYDYLTVDVGIEVFRPGNYSLMGSLYDDQGRELVWSPGSGYFLKGAHTVHMDFDGKTLVRSKTNMPYHLRNLTLFSGDSFPENLSYEDSSLEAYTTGHYNYSQFVDPTWPERVISGSGFGEILLTISVESILSVFQGRYNYDIVGANIPPITSNWSVTSINQGYAYDLPGVYMPERPNDFTVIARGVKNLNVGVRKEQNPGSEDSFFRSWLSSRAIAGDDGTAVLKDDKISPGIYHFKIFGDAADNATQVALELNVIKKLVINGDFTLALNTSGFPLGNYSINAQAVNGSLRLDEISLEGPSSGF
jgi:hypothetical protein